MRILFTLNSSNYGGMEKTVLDLVKGLPGFVKFVVCPEGDYFQDFKEFAQVKKFRPIKKFDLEYIKFLRSLIIENEINVVHANEPKVVFNTLLATLFTPVKIKITHTHTPISMWQVSNFNKFVNILMNTFIVNLLSTKEIALTESIKKQKIKEGILTTKLKVIPNSLDSNFMHEVDTYIPQKTDKDYINKVFTKDFHSFLYLSRLTKEKNQILLINTFYEFLKKYPKSELIIAGKGSSYEILKKRIRDLNLSNNIKIITEVTNRDKVNLYLNCDTFIFPSLAEGFGITLLEAMYTCYPVISSNLPVLKEVSQNRILFFKSNSQKSLFSKMEDTLKVTSKDKNLKENQNFIRENYTIEKYIANYLEVYKI